VRSNRIDVRHLAGIISFLAPDGVVKSQAHSAIAASDASLPYPQRIRVRFCSFPPCGPDFERSESGGTWLYRGPGTGCVPEISSRRTNVYTHFCDCSMTRIATGQTVF